MQDEIETILRETRRIAPGADDNFDMRDMTQIADAMASATTTMTGMLGAVAGVSLLVGGIGIMNIMLVSVTERTREIGIRLAIGAQERHILIQFLVEATVLSLLGGLIGIALGLALAGAASLTLSIPVRAEPRRHPARRRLLGADRHGVRLLPGAARRPARSDRGAAARVAGYRFSRSKMPFDRSASYAASARLEGRARPRMTTGPVDFRLGLASHEIGECVRRFRRRRASRK